MKVLEGLLYLKQRVTLSNIFHKYEKGQSWICTISFVLQGHKVLHIKNPVELHSLISIPRNTGGQKTSNILEQGHAKL